MKAQETAARAARSLLALLACCATAGAADSAASSTWPVDSGEVTREFFGKHSGIDILAPAGTEVRAYTAGTVIGRDVNKTCGEQVRIRHVNGTVALYCNLTDIVVNVGADVAPGERLGAIAPPPGAVRSHLHFELKVDDKKVDPLMHLPRSPA